MDAIHIDSRHDHFANHEVLTPSQDELAFREWLVPLRCNFWVQVAYALFLIGPLSPFLYSIVKIDLLLSMPFYAPCISLFLLFITLNGKDSLRAYRRIYGHIETHGKFDERVQRLYMEQKYCSRAGARLAAKDLGVSHQVLPTLANSWRIV